MTNHRIWYKITAQVLRQAGIGLLAASLVFTQALGQTSLLPDGKQQFLSNTGVPLASGKVFMYVPNTTTFKNTWQDAAQATLNTNPIILDSSGRALIYGSGVYRQLVQTSAGVTIYDAVTTGTLGASDVSYFIANATSTGTANAQLIAATTPATFALTTNYTLTFKPGFANTGATQINVASTGLRNLMKASAAGPTALTGGELVAAQDVQVVYDGTQYVLNTPLPPLELVNAQTGTTYTFLNSDNSKLVTAFNAAAQAYTLPQAGAASAFLTGWFTDIHNKSTNAAGVVTITPVTSTIDGAATLALNPGDSARLVSDGTNYQAAYRPNFPLVVSTQVFSATATYTRRTGLIYAIIECLGSGGGGGGGTGTAGTLNIGGGGGAGSYSRAIASAATIGATQAVTVGALGTGGAAGNNNGTAGGDVSFGSLCVGKGGSGGTFGASNTPGVGGTGGVTGTGNIIVTTGMSGQTPIAASISTVNSPIAFGGSSIWGSGGKGVVVTAGGAVSSAASGFGSGGSSGGNINNISVFAGSNGTAGYVIVTEFSNQ